MEKDGGILSKHTGRMKNYILFLLLSCLLGACGRHSSRGNMPRNISVDLRLKTTPVKNQDNSSLCWVYAMLATIETEHLMQGDSVNLSADYVARMFLREQAMQRIFQPRSAAKTLGRVTTRGTSPMLIRLIQTYGLEHQDGFHRAKSTDYNAISHELTQRLGSMAKPSAKEVDAYLDKHINLLPRAIFMEGVLYTPLEFAHSVCRADEYAAITSFTHHPYGQSFPLEVPDNYYHDTFRNIPFEELIPLIEGSLRAGHPVCWEGDISESGFDWAAGYADLPAEQLPVTAQKRQKAFENGDTTDDHCMAIVGLAHDSEGRKYFLCKNSWGDTNRYKGFFFLSYDYVKLKTMALMLPQ